MAMQTLDTRHLIFIANRFACIERAGVDIKNSTENDVAIKLPKLSNDVE